MYKNILYIDPMGPQIFTDGTVMEEDMIVKVIRAQSIVGDRKEGRPEHDFYPTPKEAVYPLLLRVPFIGGIWECACGKGDISDTLIEEGYNVISTDLIDYGYGMGGVDFLKVNKLLAPNIVTNPPFKLATEFVYHALEDLKAEKLCLLCKLSFLESVERKKMFEKFPSTWVYVFSKRLTMTRNGEPSRNGGMIAFAWFVWEKGYKNYPRIDWI